MREPGYISLHKNGVLSQRIDVMNQRLKECDICPHRCGTNRYESNTGFCRTFHNAYVCSFGAHHGEEPPLSGSNGSGTIFFGYCNMSCIYCQNFDISQTLDFPDQYTATPGDLARMMLHLQNNQHCHNINFVSPSHVVSFILAALELAVPQGLHIPLVYNSNGYDLPETLQSLAGIIDIYLPDLKYADNTLAYKYSGIKNYVSAARTAIKEMYQQVGLLRSDKNEIARSGLIIRHLVLPLNTAGSKNALDWICSELTNQVTLSLMAQYHPTNRAAGFPELNRRLKRNEYLDVLTYAEKLGFTNLLYQQIG